MSEETKVIKQSVNKVQIVGTLQELNFTVENSEVELTNGKTKKKVTCQTIKKADFKNPNLTVEVKPVDDDGNVRYTSTIGVNFYPTHDKKLDENGAIVDNPRFKALQTIMEYKPKETRVKIDGTLNANEYGTSKDGGKTFEFASFPQINAFQVTSNGVPDDDMAEGELTGIIRSIKDETRTKNDEQEETGRKIVEFYSFDRNGKTTPQNLIVEKDLADDFEDIYETGQSCKLYYEIIARQVGGQKRKTKAAFGSRESKIVDGFNVTEYSIFRGDEPFEEENEYYIDMDAMKQAMKERDNYKDTIIADAKKRATEKNSGTGTTKRGLGNRTSKVEESAISEEEDLESCPF
jgi:hypothetical protein